MILEEATFEAYGYYARDLKPQSNKSILAACDECGKVRETSKNDYRALCPSCVQKGNTYCLGNTLTEEHKAKISAAHKGNTYALGYKHTDETKENMSAAAKGNTNALDYTFTEEQSATLSAAMKGKNYKGGKKAADARTNAKRKRQLGYTLLMPLAAGEVGHHVTNAYVIGIPAEVHNIIGGRRKKHRTLVLQWLKANDKKKYKLALNVL